VVKLVKLSTYAWQEAVKSWLQKSSPRRKMVITEPRIFGF